MLPPDNALHVDRAAAITLELALPNVGGGLDRDSLTPANVLLFRAEDQVSVTVHVNTSGGGDVLMLRRSGLPSITTFLMPVHSAGL